MLGLLEENCRRVVCPDLTESGSDYFGAKVLSAGLAMQDYTVPWTQSLFGLLDLVALGPYPEVAHWGLNLAHYVYVCQYSMLFLPLVYSE